MVELTGGLCGIDRHSADGIPHAGGFFDVPNRMTCGHLFMMEASPVPRLQALSAVDGATATNVSLEGCLKETPAALGAGLLASAPIVGSDHMPSFR